MLPYKNRKHIDGLKVLHCCHRVVVKKKLSIMIHRAIQEMPILATIVAARITTARTLADGSACLANYFWCEQGTLFASRSGVYPPQVPLRPPRAGATTFFNLTENDNYKLAFGLHQVSYAHFAKRHQSRANLYYREPNSWHGNINYGIDCHAYLSITFASAD